MTTAYGDCDGHVMEKFDELIQFVGEPIKIAETAAAQALSTVLAPHAGPNETVGPMWSAQYRRERS